jgi:hypothetical protein
MTSRWQKVMLAGVLALTTLARAESDRLPAPTGAALTAARQQVRADHKDEFKNAQLPKTRTALAATLVSAANKGDPDQRYAMLAEAMDLYRDAGDLPGAMKVADDAGKVFDVDTVTMKVALVKSTPKSTLNGTPKPTVQALYPLVDQCIAADKYPEAKEIADLGLAAAKASGERELVQQQTDLVQDVEQIQKNFNAIAPTIATLKEKPTDPAANLKYGRFLCFMKGDWGNGLPCLAACPDASLRAMAQREQGDSPAMEKGDAMWKFADGQMGLIKRRCRQRAAVWYQDALTVLTGPDRARVQARLAEVPGLIAKKSGFDPVGQWQKDTGTVFTLNPDGTIDSTSAEHSPYKHGKWTFEDQKLMFNFGSKTVFQMEVLGNDELREIVTIHRADGQWLLHRKPAQ